MALKQNHQSTTRPLHEFLMGFGILLPPANCCTSTYHEEKGAFEDLKATGPDMFNAFLLDSIGHVKLKWMDAIFGHFKFDKRTNTIFSVSVPTLLRCPPTTRPRGPRKGRQVRFTQLLLQCLFFAAMRSQRRIYKTDAQRNIDILQNVVRAE